MELTDVILTAKGLASEMGDNPEYDRALVELVARLMNEVEMDPVSVARLLILPEARQ